MANFDTGQDILRNVLSRADELGIGAADFETEAKAYIQAAYVSVLEAFPWVWGRKTTPGILNAVAEITTGTVTLTQGSTAMTFSSAPVVSVAGRKIYANNDMVVSRIASHTAGETSATLDSAYQGDGGGGLSYHVFQNEHDLASDFLIPAESKRFLKDCHGTYDMDLISPSEMAAKFPYPSRSSSFARYCSIIRKKKIRLEPWPTEVRRYEYEYNYHPGVLSFTGVAGTDTPLIDPAEDRIVIAFLATANLLVDKDDDRAQAHVESYNGKLSNMKRMAARLLKPRIWMRPQFAVGTAR